MCFKSNCFHYFTCTHIRCADVWPEVVAVDPDTDLPRATHPSRSFYYTFVSIVLYFFPIVIMSFAYCFIILKLSQRPPGEYVDSDACRQIKVKRRVRQFRRSLADYRRLRARLQNTVTAPWKWVVWHPMRPFTCRRRRRRWRHAVPIGSWTHFGHRKNAVHGSGAVAVSCKRVLNGGGTCF